MDGRKVRSDSDRQPYIQQHAHGTGAVIAGIAGLTIDCSTVAVEMHTTRNTYSFLRTTERRTLNQSFIFCGGSSKGNLLVPVLTDRKDKSTKSYNNLLHPSLQVLLKH